MTTIAEANAVNTVAHYLLGEPTHAGPVDPDQARVALDYLITRSYKTLSAGYTPEMVAARWANPAAVHVRLAVAAAHTEPCPPPTMDGTGPCACGQPAWPCASTVTAWLIRGHLPEVQRHRVLTELTDKPLQPRATVLPPPVERPDYADLGELIDALECQDPARVLPFGITHPHSYRGDYGGVGFEVTGPATVAQVLEIARSALGKTYTGYKGGEFTVDRDSFVYLVSSVDYGGEPLGVLFLAILCPPPPRP